MMYSSSHITHSNAEHDLGTNTPNSTIFPYCSIANQLTSHEQRRDFELLRLAEFVLKLHKLEQSATEVTIDANDVTHQERTFQHLLLHHVIFQQVLALNALDAHNEALQLIAARQYL